MTESVSFVCAGCGYSCTVCDLETEVTLTHCTECANKRISELQELADRVKNGFQGGCWCCETVAEKNIELQRKYDALVERLEHMAEMWDEKDRAAWRTDPSKHLNGFKCADELRALLEDE